MHARLCAWLCIPALCFDRLALGACCQAHWLLGGLEQLYWGIVYWGIVYWEIVYWEIAVVYRLYVGCVSCWRRSCMEKETGVSTHTSSMNEGSVSRMRRCITTRVLSAIWVKVARCAATYARRPYQHGTRGTYHPIVGGVESLE